MSRVVLVGSRKQETDLSPFIDQSDVVVRMTQMVGRGDFMGDKTDVWCVRTDGWPRQRSCYSDEVFHRMQLASITVPEVWITIPNHPIGDGEIDLDSEFNMLSERADLVMTRSCGIWDRPSIGMLALLHCLERYPEHEIYLAGYSRTLEESLTKKLEFHHGDREFTYQQGLVDAGRIARV